MDMSEPIMDMSEPIKPALTAEEWKRRETRWSANGRHFWIATSDQDRACGDYRLSIGAERETWAAHGLPDDEKQHAVAALTLYGQPFGFRHDQVSWLREEADILKHAGAGAGALMCNEIADTIEALLPPVSP